MEGKYPPVGLTAYTSQVSGQAYGNGQYVITYSYKNEMWYNDPLYALNGKETEESYSASFVEGGYYCGTGSTYYCQGAFLASSDYKGDWLALQMPARVKPLRVRLYLSTAVDYRVYGKNSDDPGGPVWTQLLEVKGATYSSSVHISPEIV